MSIKNNNGITLVALIVTIIVLLILAGISISAVVGENGVLTNSQTVKEQTEISNEKESLRTAAIEAISESNDGAIESKVLQDKLDNIAGSDETEVSEEDDIFVVEFTSSGRKYLVDEEGNVSEYDDSTT